MPGPGAAATECRHWRALPALLVLSALPWTVVLAGGSPSLFFTVGFVNVDPLGLTTITDYDFRYTKGLPRFLNAYGIGVTLFALALASALAGRVWREDARVTAALLVIAGLCQVWFALGFLRRPETVAVPTGTVLLWGVVWWYYRQPFKSVFAGAGEPD